MTEPRLYHGGPAGLREILPGPDRGYVCVTSEPRLARFYAAKSAAAALRPAGVVYEIEPAGGLDEADIDSPFTWRVPSARVIRTVALVRADELPALIRWLYRWSPGAFRRSDAREGLAGMRDQVTANARAVLAGRHD